MSQETEIRLAGGNFTFVSNEESYSLDLSDRDTVTRQPRHRISQTVPEISQAEKNEFRTPQQPINADICKSPQPDVIFFLHCKFAFF